MQLSEMPVLHPQYAFLTREHILDVDVAARTLLLPTGPISFVGKEIALCFPDCPAAGLSFDDAGGLYKKDSLVKELQMSIQGNRHADIVIPDVKFKELLTRRYELLKGERLVGSMPWYIVSAAYAEYSGTGVNWADEVAGRMLEALLAFKHGRKKLKFEAEILKHISLKMSELYGSEVVQAPQLVTPGEEQGCEVVLPLVEFSEPEGKPGLKPEPAQQLVVREVQEALHECDVIFQEFGEVEVKPLAAEVTEASVVDEEKLPCDGGGLGDVDSTKTLPSEERIDTGNPPTVEDTGPVEKCQPEEIMDERRTQEEGWPKPPEDPITAETGVSVEVHLNGPLLPFTCEPAFQEPVHVEVLRCDAAEEQQEHRVLEDCCAPCDICASGKEDVVQDSTCLKEQNLSTTVHDSTCLKEQDPNTASVDLGSISDVVPDGHDVTIEDRVQVVKKRIQTRSTAGSKLLSKALISIQDRHRTKQEECKQLEAAIQEKEHQRILSHTAKMKRTLTDLHTAIRTSEGSLSRARKERAELVQRHQKIAAKLREAEQENKELLRQLTKARDESYKQMAERERTLADGMQDMRALQAVKMAKVAEMHVKKRKMEEQNVPLEEREISNSGQIWELEKALFDQGQSLDALWLQWQTQHLKCEELVGEETRLHTSLINSFQISARLQDEEAKLVEELKEQDACIAEFESHYSWLEETKKATESELQVENSAPDSPNPLNLESSTGCSKRKNLDIEREHKRRNQDTEREMANIWQRTKEQESVWSRRSVRGFMGVV